MGLTAQDAKTWESVRTTLRRRVGDATYRSWIEPLDISAIDGEDVILEAPSSYLRNRVQSDYDLYIREVFQDVAPTVRRVRYLTRDGDDADVAEMEAGASDEGSDVFRETARPASVAAGVEDGPGAIALDDRMRFESFVVGRPNEFAHAAATRVADDPLTPFNPLFLHGDPGLGKTHLLHSIAWRRRSLFPDQRVILISAETFLVEFISALRNKDTLGFKDYMRSADLLLIDDVQLLFGKERTQEEFFHTFNALLARKKQIVLSADEPPTDLNGLTDRLRSRLSWGLVADLHPTDYELRRGILEAKIEAARKDAPNLVVDKKVLDFLARRIISDVRTLEGAVNRLLALASLQDRAVTIEMAQGALQNVLRHSDRKVSIEEIQRKVAEHFEMRFSDMHSARRSRSIARPRQVAMYLGKQLTQKSLPEIGQKFGGRDHTTVMHAIKKITQLREIDAAFNEEVERLRRSLEG